MGVSVKCELKHLATGKVAELNALYAAISAGEIETRTDICFGA